MSFWDHVSNPAPRLSAHEWRKKEDTRVAKLMRAPADTAPASPPPRVVAALPHVYRKEEVRRVEVQRPLDLDDEFIHQHPQMAAALTAAHRMRVPFELTH